MKAAWPAAFILQLSFHQDFIPAAHRFLGAGGGGAAIAGGDRYEFTNLRSAPSANLRRLLAPGAFLAPLLAKRTLEGIELEVHLRRKEEVHLYCDLTRLAASGPGTGGKVWVKSHKSYTLQNVWEWHRALNSGRSSVQELLDARVELGLSPRGVPPITGRIRAVVGFGEDEPRGEVRCRYSRVLRISNRLLSADVPPIETWSLAHGQPAQVF